MQIFSAVLFLVVISTIYGHPKSQFESTEDVAVVAKASEHHAISKGSVADLNAMNRQAKLHHSLKKRYVDSLGGAELPIYKRAFDSLGGGQIPLYKKSFDSLGGGHIPLYKKSFDSLGGGNIPLYKKSFDSLGGGHIPLYKKSFDSLGGGHVLVYKKNMEDFSPVFEDQEDSVNEDEVKLNQEED